MRRSTASIVVALSLCLATLAAAVPASAHDANSQASDHPVPYIIDGTPTTVTAWPSMAALIEQTPDGLVQRCGGTLIRADLVVTAAHCTEDYLADASQLRVLLGRTDLAAAGGEFVEVAAIIPYPSYVPEPYYQADLALIRLAQPSLLAPTRVATHHTEPDWTRRPDARVAGWGATNADPRVTDTVLRQRDVAILADEVCQDITTFQPGVDLCGGTTGGGPCFGDSGGPLIARSGDTNLLAGVISRGPSDCLRHAGIFTRMAAYADWIFATTQSPNTTRSSGADRYVTAAGLASHFSPGVPVVYLVTGEAFPDAVTAAAVAGASGGPVLLTYRDELPESTRTQLARLDPQRLVVVGGTAAISDPVAQAAATAAGVPGIRLSGSDRYATAVALASDAQPAGSGTVFVAVGTSFPDAVTSGPVAGGADGGPVLLTERDQLPQATRDELARLSPNRVIILGGTGAVAPHVADAIAAAVPAASVTRISGADRYTTAAALSAASFSPGVPVVYVATGRAFPDALASGPVAAGLGAPVLLVDGAVVPPAVAAEIRRLGPARIVVLGGAAAIPAETAWHLDGLLVP